MPDGVQITPRRVSGGGQQPAVQQKYKITIYAHLDSPNDAIGHAFISLEYPLGTVTTRGFWPAKGFDLSRLSDKFKVVFGMEGALHDDADYISKEGMTAKRMYEINEAQAKKAQQVIMHYEKNKPLYKLLSNQCAVFALRVLAATGHKLNAGSPANPRDLYQTLSGQKLKKIKASDLVKA